MGGVVEGEGEARVRATNVNTNKDKHEWKPFMFAFVHVCDWEAASEWIWAVRDGEGGNKQDGMNGASIYMQVETECGK